MANRLAGASSPYLLQHAENPVDWWEWGTEAFAEAGRRGVPVLLSVGYSSCHWCHVMAHESFEDAEVASYLNEHFVAIKVDREERPDIDAVYMRATQAMTGQGGWPMTCFLTPDAVPFYAGTYFPPEPRGQMPSFSQLLQSIAQSWHDQPDDVTAAAERVRDYLVTTAGDGLEPGIVDAAALDRAAAGILADFDSEAGGFGPAPKFPAPMALEFLLRHHARTGDTQALNAVSSTCEAMTRGGIHDQLGGGFARYSVDRHWRVPHFEKMLYDNAQLLRLYLHWWRATDSPLAERVARGIARFLIDELRTPEGGFASALDADSDGHEGTFYVWNPNQLMRALGTADAAWATGLFGLTAQGTFERGLSTLQLPHDPDDADRFERVRRALLEVRATRTRPARDDKVVAAWNALAITALSEAGTLLAEPDFTAAAVAAAELLWDVHLAGPFVRTSLGGERSAHAAVLDDHALVVEAFVATLGVTGDARWLQRAEAVLDRIQAHFADHEGGGFFDTADDQGDELIVRPRDASDNVTPSGLSAVAHAALAVWAVTGTPGHRDLAERAVAAAAELADKAPRYAAWSLAAAEALLAGPRQVAVVGEPGQPRDRLVRAAARQTSPGQIVVTGAPGLDIALFAGRGTVDGQPAAYVCDHFVCALPVTDPAALTSL